VSPAVLVLPLSVVALGAAARAAARAGRHATIAVRLPSDAAGGGQRLRPPPPPAWLEAALLDAAVDIPAATVWAAWLAALVVAALGAVVVSGVAAGVLAALVVGGVAPVALRARRGRADSRLEEQLPLALESIARSLRSGASVRQAIAEAAAAPGGLRGGARAGGGRRGSTRGRLQTELAIVADQAGHGAGLVEALEALAARRPRPGVRLAVAALCLGVDTGGAQARAVDGVAATMRERLAVEAEVRALSSQARMSALVIGLAPLGFGAFAAATDPRTSEFLLHTPVGLALVGVGLLLDGAGWLWMQRLCRVAP
jgi:tight adherence protein B